MSSQAPGDDRSPDQYVFITPVWGEQYVDRFVKVSLRTQLSAGNLGAVPPGKGLYLIYTRKQDAPVITRSPAYRQLKATIPVSVRLLDDLPDPRFSDNPHGLQTAAYTRGIRAGAGRETAFVFLTPDILLADGTVRNAIRLVEQQKRVVLVAGVRMTTEGAVNCIATHRTPGRADAPVPSRTLVRTLLDNLHPISRGHLVAPNGSVQIAQHLYWMVGNHGLHARGFHLHPLLVWPRHPAADIRVTVDDEYVERACPDRADWYTVTDSDEICVLEFSDRGHKSGMLNAAPVFSDPDVIGFMAESTTPTHRLHVLHHIRFHTRDVDPADWAPAAERSDRLVNKFLHLFETGVTDWGGHGPSPAALTRLLEAPAAPAPAGVSAAKRLRTLIAPPARWLYRLINYPLYQYAGRLNAELIRLRTVLHQTRNQLADISRRVEALGQSQEPSTPSTRLKGLGGPKSGRAEPADDPGRRTSTQAIS